MLVLRPQNMFNMFNMFAASNPMANGFIKARRAATAAGFIVYSGIISVTVALWMWMSRNTTFQLGTITIIAALALICSSVYHYPRLHRGFGTFCLILSTSGIGLAILSQKPSSTPWNQSPDPRHRARLCRSDRLLDSDSLHLRYRASSSRLPCWNRLSLV